MKASNVSESKNGQGAQRVLAAEHFVMRSRGETFTHTAFMRALKIPTGTAHRYLSWLEEEGVIDQDEDTRTYCMSQAFRNMLVATSLSLTPVQKEAS
jgi:DNA-binding IclR family transcriptional regulator